MKKLLKILILSLVLLSPLFSWQKNIAGNTFLINHKGFVVQQRGLLNGSLVAINTPLKIRGIVKGSVLTIGSGLLVYERALVKKNIIAIGSNFRLKKYSKVKGNVLSFWGRMIKEQGANARCFNISILAKELGFTRAFKIFLVYLSFVLLGLFFTYFFMNNFIFVGEYLKKRFWPMLFFGVLVLPLALLLMLLFMGTYIGFLFLPALVFVYVFYFFFSFYAVAMFIGEKFVKLFTFRDYPYYEQFMGISILFLISLIPVVGLFLLIGFLLVGLGANLRLKCGVR